MVPEPEVGCMRMTCKQLTLFHVILVGSIVFACKTQTSSMSTSLAARQAKPLGALTNSAPLSIAHTPVTEGFLLLTSEVACQRHGLQGARCSLRAGDPCQGTHYCQGQNLIWCADGVAKTIYNCQGLCRSGDGVYRTYDDGTCIEQHKQSTCICNNLINTRRKI